MESLTKSSNGASKLFRRYSYEIYKGIVNPTPLSWSLFSENIIDRFTLDKTHGNVSKHHQISALLEGILARLDSIPDDLERVLNAFKEHVPDVVIEKIKEDLVCKTDVNSTHTTDDIYITDIQSTIDANDVHSTIDSGINNSSENLHSRKVIVREYTHKDFQKMRSRLGILIYRVQKIAESSVRLQDLKQLIIVSHPFLEEQIKTSEDIGEIFVKIRHHCTLTNYTLLATIAEVFELSKASELIEKYSIEADHYKQKLLDEKFVKELHNGSSPLRDDEISIELKLEWSNVDYITVKEFKDVLRDVFSKMDCYVHLDDVRPGCVHCTCRAPAVLEKVLRKLAEERAEFLIRRGVVSLLIGGVAVLGKSEMENDNTDVSDVSEGDVLNTLSANTSMELKINRQDSDTVNPPLLTLAADRLIPNKEQLSSLPSVTIEAPPIPPDIANLLQMYLSHQGCHMTAATCSTCSFLSGRTRALLCLPPDVSSLVTSSLPHPRLLSCDEGLGRSISTEDDPKFSSENLPSSPTSLNHAHNDPTSLETFQSLDDVATNSLHPSMHQLALSGLYNSLDRSSFDSGIGQAESLEVEPELKLSLGASDKKKASPLLGSKVNNTHH